MSLDESHHDRQARMLRLEHMLCQNVDGMTVAEMAKACGVSTRTIRRDLVAMEEAMKLPVWQEGTRRGIDRNHYLPPIRFSAMEALAILMAVRLYQGMDRDCDSEILDTFLKLNNILPARFQEQVRLTLDRVRGRQQDTQYSRTLRCLCQAMLEGRKCHISYWSMGDDEPGDRTIAPYFIEPVARERAVYVIGRCDRTAEVRTFKLDRILECRVLDETYAIPQGFTVDKYLGNSFSVFTPSPSRPVKTIVLKFAPAFARYMEESRCHPSQVNEKLADGSLKVTLRVADTPDFVGWILGWGDQVEVLEPPGLRRQVRQKAEAVAVKYRRSA